MTELQKIIKEVFTEFEYDDEHFITTPKVVELEKLLLEKVDQLKPPVMTEIAGAIKRLQELQSLYNENEPQYNAFGIAVNEIKRTFYTEPLEREQNTGSCNWDYLRSR